MLNSLATCSFSPDSIHPMFSLRGVEDKKVYGSIPGRRTLRNDASQVAAIDKLSVVLVAVIALIFLKERLNTAEVCGILLITAGAIVVARA